MNSSKCMTSPLNQVYGRRHEENCRRCPVTATLTDHPSILSVIFSVLPPGKSLPSHKVRASLGHHFPRA